MSYNDREARSASSRTREALGGQVGRFEQERLVGERADPFEVDDGVARQDAEVVRDGATAADLAGRDDARREHQAP